MEKNIHKIIGRNIKANRTALGLSVEETAELLSLSPSFWGLMERGERGTRIANLMRIAKVFNVSLNELVSDSTKEDDKDKNFLTLISSLTRDFDDNKREALVTMIKALRQLD